eukprot:g6645.t1
MLSQHPSPLKSSPERELVFDEQFERRVDHWDAQRKAPRLHFEKLSHQGLPDSWRRGPPKLREDVIGKLEKLQRIPRDTLRFVGCSHEVPPAIALRVALRKVNAHRELHLFETPEDFMVLCDSYKIPWRSICKVRTLEDLTLKASFFERKPALPDVRAYKITDFVDGTLDPLLGSGLEKCILETMPPALRQELQDRVERAKKQVLKQPTSEILKKAAADEKERRIRAGKRKMRFVYWEGLRAMEEKKGAARKVAKRQLALANGDAEAEENVGIAASAPEGASPRYAPVPVDRSKFALPEPGYGNLLQRLSDYASFLEKTDEMSPIRNPAPGPLDRKLQRLAAVREDDERPHVGVWKIGSEKMRILRDQQRSNLADEELVRSRLAGSQYLSRDDFLQAAEGRDLGHGSAGGLGSYGLHPPIELMSPDEKRAYYNSKDDGSPPPPDHYRLRMSTTRRRRTRNEDVPFSKGSKGTLPGRYLSRSPEKQSGVHNLLLRGGGSSIVDQSRLSFDESSLFEGGGRDSARGRSGPRGREDDLDFGNMKVRGRREELFAEDDQQGGAISEAAMRRHASQPSPRGGHVSVTGSPPPGQEEPENTPRTYLNAVGGIRRSHSESPRSGRPKNELEQAVGSPVGLPDNPLAPPHGLDYGARGTPTQQSEQLSAPVGFYRRLSNVEKWRNDALRFARESRRLSKGPRYVRTLLEVLTDQVAVLQRSIEWSAINYAYEMAQPHTDHWQGENYGSLSGDPHDPVNKKWPDPEHTDRLHDAEEALLRLQKRTIRQQVATVGRGPYTEGAREVQAALRANAELENARSPQSPGCKRDSGPRGPVLGGMEGDDQNNEELPYHDGATGAAHPQHAHNTSQSSFYNQSAAASMMSTSQSQQFGGGFGSTQNSFFNQASAGGGGSKTGGPGSKKSTQQSWYRPPWTSKVSWTQSSWFNPSEKASQEGTNRSPNKKQNHRGSRSTTAASSSAFSSRSTQLSSMNSRMLRTSHAQRHGSKLSPRYRVETKHGHFTMSVALPTTSTEAIFRAGRRHMSGDERVRNPRVNGHTVLNEGMVSEVATTIPSAARTGSVVRYSTKMHRDEDGGSSTASPDVDKKRGKGGRRGRGGKKTAMVPKITGVLAPPGESTYKPPDPSKTFKSSLLETTQNSDEVENPPGTRTPPLNDIVSPGKDVRANQFTSPAFVRYTRLEVTSLYRAGPAPMLGVDLVGRDKLPKMANKASASAATATNSMPMIQQRAELERVPVMTQNVGVYPVPAAVPRVHTEAEREALEELTEISAKEKAPERTFTQVQGEFGARAAKELADWEAEEAAKREAARQSVRSPPQSPKPSKVAMGVALRFAGKAKKVQSMRKVLGALGSSEALDAGGTEHALPEHNAKLLVLGAEGEHNATWNTGHTSCSSSSDTDMACQSMLNMHVPATTFATETVFERSGKGSLRTPSEFAIVQSKQLEEGYQSHSSPEDLFGSSFPGSMRNTQDSFFSATARSTGGGFPPAGSAATTATSGFGAVDGYSTRPTTHHQLPPIHELQRASAAITDPLLYEQQHFTAAASSVCHRPDQEYISTLDNKYIKVPRDTDPLRVLIKSANKMISHPAADHDRKAARDFDTLLAKWKRDLMRSERIARASWRVVEYSPCGQPFFEFCVCDACKNAYWLQYRYHHPEDSNQNKELDPLTGQPKASGGAGAAAGAAGAGAGGSGPDGSSGAGGVAAANPQGVNANSAPGSPTAAGRDGAPSSPTSGGQDRNGNNVGNQQNAADQQQQIQTTGDKKTVVLLVDGRYLLNPIALEGGAAESLKLGYAVANVPPYVWEDRSSPKYFLADVGFVIRGFDRFAAAPRVLPAVAPHSLKKLLSERGAVELLAYLGHVRKDRGREESSEVERELNRIRLFAGFGSQLDFNSFLLMLRLDELDRRNPQEQRRRKDTGKTTG